MSDWNRTGRDDDQRRYGAENRDRREFGGQDRWRDQNRRDREQRSFGEQRSFDEQRAGGGFGQSDFDRNPVADQQRDFSERFGRDYDRDRDYGREEHRGQRFGQRGSQDYRSQGYGQDYGAQERQRQGYGGQGYGGQSYGGERYGGQESRFGQGGGAMGSNPMLQRISEGEADQGWRANMGAGEHRGRGPKNYTRSDERIREDVNDRLSDDPWLDASEVEVQVSKCEVTLTGTVQNRDDKRRAEDIAEQVSGVKHVQNSLRVQPSATQGMSGQQSGRQQTGGQSSMGANARTNT